MLTPAMDGTANAYGYNMRPLRSRPTCIAVGFISQSVATANLQYISARLSLSKMPRRYLGAHICGLHDSNGYGAHTVDAI